MPNTDPSVHSQADSVAATSYRGINYTRKVGKIMCQCDNEVKFVASTKGEFVIEPDKNVIRVYSLNRLRSIAETLHDEGFSNFVNDPDATTAQLYKKKSFTKILIQKENEINDLIWGALRAEANNQAINEYKESVAQQLDIPREIQGWGLDADAVGHRGSKRLVCPYCGTVFAVKRQKSEILFTVVGRAQDFEDQPLQIPALVRRQLSFSNVGGNSLGASYVRVNEQDSLSSVASGTQSPARHQTPSQASADQNPAPNRERSKKPSKSAELEKRMGVLEGKFDKMAIILVRLLPENERDAALQELRAQ